MRGRSLVLVAALLAAGCDKGSQPGGQGNASGGNDTSANGQSPDEAPPRPSANSVGAQAGFIDARKDTPAPAVVFTDPDGKRVSLAAYRGKPVLLNLWATWCGPCVKELPTLAKTNGRIRVVTLDQGEDAAKVKSFLQQHQLTGVPAYTDPTGHWLGTTVDSLPTSILYDAKGNEVWRLVGPYDWTSPSAAKALDRAR